MSDLAETIAAYRGMTAQYYSHDFISISHADLTRLLDAAEAAATARDAALEEAAQIAERQYPDAIPGAIRSLKGAA